MIEPHIYTIKKGERFAQLLVEGLSDIEEAFATPDTSIPQHEGFGSTGKM
jgi:dUTPase